MRKYITKKMRTRKFDGDEARTRQRTTEEQWYTPTPDDVYAQLKVAETMLCRIPDPNLASVKRSMGILEDMLWQFTQEGVNACR